MSKNYLTEAFKELDLLESQSFDVDKKGTSELEDFLEDDSLDDFEVVIDPEAETEEDLQKSYMGKAILMCDVCHSMIYKDPAEIVIDEESQLANVGELCPYCFTGDGYKVVGKVAPYEEVTVEAEKPVEVKVDGEEVEVEDKIDEEIQQDQKFPVNHEEAPAMDIDLSEGYSKNEFSWEERNGEIKIFLDGQYHQTFPSKEAAIDAGWDLDSMNEEIQKDQKFPVDHKKSPVMEGNKKLKKSRIIEASNSNTKRFTLDMLHNAILDPQWSDDVKSMKDNIKSGNKFYLGGDIQTVLDGLSQEGTLTIPRRFARDPDNVDDDEAYAYFDYLLDKYKLTDVVTKWLSEDDSLKESMEDISITTDDQVIKIKSTPREDKETIQPVTETEVEKAKEAEEDIPVEEVETQEEVVEEEPEEVDVDLDEIDEEGMDDLGESYLKSVYENVNGFKTSKAVLQGNKMILEGVISFTSGNKAKTKFIFESKETTKRGKLKFLGENKNISKNKKAFTLIGSLNNKKLMLESLNYNYTGKDSKTGKTKRLYGTIRRKSK